MNFFEKVFPLQGLICVVHVGTRGLQQRFFESLDDAIANAMALDAQGHTVYMAQATYSEEKIAAATLFNSNLPKDALKTDRKKRRSQANVHLVKSFWLDIDCGPGKPYADQTAGCEAISQMVAQTNLPFPCVVRSGNGLYAHWFLNEEIPEAQWRGVARLLKDTLIAYDFTADPARTSDSASILRPPGTTNRKNGTEKPVVIIKDAEPIPFATFTDALSAAAKIVKVDTAVLKIPKKQTAYDEFLSGISTGPASSAAVIAEKCNQIKIIRDTKGNVPEPFWYAALCLLHYTEEAPEIQHLWSSGHPEYSYEQTEAKDLQIHTPPTTCHMFGMVNPQGCVGCAHAQKLHSPIALGYNKAMSEEGKWCPVGFKRTKDGLMYEDEDGTTLVYPWDIWVDQIAFDESLGYETIIIKHMMPFEGERELAVRSSLPNDNKAFMIELHDHHVQIIGKREKLLMGAYMDNYIRRLRTQQKMSMLFCQMGWRGDDEEDKTNIRFVLGESVFGPGDKVQGAGLAKNIPDLVKGFKCLGEKDLWIEATKYLAAPEMLIHAFALLAGGFGAPLMRFTGYAGAVLSIVGKSGIGKTLMGTFILSLYGRPEKLSCRKDDTPNALISRLGIFGSLPMYIDETSNIDPLALSDFVYKITQGRDKARLTQKAVEKSNLNTWNTVTITSSNHSLIERLGQAKADASAEINRVFEVFPIESDYLTRELATHLYRTISMNCGYAGAEYIKYLVLHADEHQAQLDKLISLIESRSGGTAEERFWSALGAVAIYGGLIAKKLGLIKFEITPIMDWFCEAIYEMRGSKNEQVTSPADALATFISQYAGNILVCDKRKDGTNKSYVFVYRELKGAVFGRLEIDTKKLYVSKSRLKDYFKTAYISMKQFAETLSNTHPRPILLRDNVRKNLGSGVDYVSTIVEPCFEFDLTIPELGYVTMALVFNAEKDNENEERKIA